MKSESIKELAAALSKAQGEIKGAIKDSANPFFKSKYADLSSVVEAIRDPLAKHGLAYVQLVREHENAASVETMILHASGEWLLCGPVSVPVSKADAQGFGSAMTYARRYSLSAAFGVAPEDDDGNAAARATPPKKESGDTTHSGKDSPTKAFDAPHKPTGDAFKSLSVDEQTFVFDLSNRVRTLATKGDIKGACDEVDETLREFDNANDLKVALYEKMADMSAVRNAMKKEWATRRLATHTTEVGTQA